MKDSIGRFATNSLSPARVQERIREGAREAIATLPEKAHGVQPFVAAANAPV